MLMVLKERKKNKTCWTTRDERNIQRAKGGLVALQPVNGGTKWKQSFLIKMELNMSMWGLQLNPFIESSKITKVFNYLINYN